MTKAMMRGGSAAFLVMVSCSVSMPALAQVSSGVPVHALITHRIRPPCISGFAWREAFAGDNVCVKQGRPDQVREENKAARELVEPGGGAYGPDTCRQGYVWRESSPTDHVCVIPLSRSRVRLENALAPSRLIRPPCGTRDECRARAAESAREVAALRQFIAERRADLQAAMAEKAQQEAAEARWKQDHPHEGHTIQPLSVDNIAPIESDIADLEKQLDQQGAATAAAASATR
jgi:hypothetical protein